MGSPNQLDLVQRHRDLFQPPYLEVGSRDYGTTQNLRALFPDDEYVGIDMLAGDGVDLVLDLTHDFDHVDHALGHRRVGTIFCVSVLEHCDQPFAMAEAITRLLRPGGRAYVSVPVAWQVHGYPCDYWRVTHEGVKELLPKLACDALAPAAHAASGEELPADDTLGQVRIKGSFHRRQGRQLRALSADALSLLAKLGPLAWLGRERYLLRPTMVDMIGTKPEM